MPSTECPIYLLLLSLLYWTNAPKGNTVGERLRGDLS